MDLNYLLNVCVGIEMAMLGTLFGYCVQRRISQINSTILKTEIYNTFRDATSQLLAHMKSRRNL